MVLYRLSMGGPVVKGHVAQHWGVLGIGSIAVTRFQRSSIDFGTTVDAVYVAVGIAHASGCVWHALCRFRGGGDSRFGLSECFVGISLHTRQSIGFPREIDAAAVVLCALVCTGVASTGSTAAACSLMCQSLVLIPGSPSASSCSQVMPSTGSLFEVDVFCRDDEVLLRELVCTTAAGTWAGTQTCEVLSLLSATPSVASSLTARFFTRLSTRSRISFFSFTFL